MDDIKHPIDRAADIVGSQVALASLLGVSKAAVNQWKDPGRKVPAEKCPAIEKATGGAVRCEDLRPDVAWGVLREQAPETPQDAQSQAERAAASLHREIEAIVYGATARPGSHSESERPTKPGSERR
jgi:DNA-binding transcriptional regulator YdaS (Cro superfamily)